MRSELKIVKEGGIYFGASVFEQAIPFILMPFLTRLFSTDEYGLLSLFTTLVVIYGLVLGGSFSSFARVIFHKVDNDEFIKQIGSIHALTLIVLGFIIILTTIFHSYIEKLIHFDSHLLISAIIVALSRYILELRLTIYQTMRKPLQYALLQITKPIFDLFLVILLVFYISDGISGRINAMVTSSTMAAFIAVILLNKEGLLTVTFDKARAKRAMNFVVPLIPHSIALTAYFTVDKIILSSNHGLSILGELAVAVSVASPTLIITESINKAFMPWSFEKFREKKLEQVVGASYLILIIMGVICLIYSGILFITFDLVIGEAFKDALMPAMILVWVGWIKLAYYLVARGIVYSENTKLIPIISILSGLIYITLLIINIEEVRVIDIAFYMILFNVSMLLGAFFLSQKKYPQPWGDFRLIKNTVLKITKY